MNKTVANNDIDIDITETETTTTKNRNRVVDFILGIYGAEILKFVFGFLVVALLAVLTIFSASALLQLKSRETTIISQLENGINFSKEWELTPALKEAIERGDISLTEITVIEKGGEITFNGSDSDKITILNYRTEIEDNDPQIYSSEYFEELKRQGKNTYVVKTLGLATEKEGAE